MLLHHLRYKAWLLPCRVSHLLFHVNAHITELLVECAAQTVHPHLVVLRVRSYKSTVVPAKVSSSAGAKSERVV